MRTINVSARWVGEDGIWIATSEDVPGLAVEGPTWTDMIREVTLVLPDLLDLAGSVGRAHIVFRAEQRLELAAA